jgi:hypothetical protein
MYVEISATEILALRPKPSDGLSDIVMLLMKYCVVMNLQ